MAGELVFSMFSVSKENGRGARHLFAPQDRKSRRFFFVDPRRRPGFEAQAPRRFFEGFQQALCGKHAVGARLKETSPMVIFPRR
jgi:hypothetical protein